MARTLRQLPHRTVSSGGNPTSRCWPDCSDWTRGGHPVAAPLLQRYDPTVPATGPATATIGRNIPGGTIVTRALLRDGVRTGPIGFQFHGAGSQGANNFLPGTPIYENAEHWRAQAVIIWGRAP
ncbi:MAG: hypothetical protein FJX25_18005 [Alphaproteobacteria bacterium]|nr:hypothetical protein [Alphaproteobacteria bacterium]